MNKVYLKLFPERHPEEPSSRPAFQPSTSGTEADTLRIPQESLSEHDGKRDYLLNAVSEHMQVFVIRIPGSLGLQIAHFSLT